MISLIWKLYRKLVWITHRRTKDKTYMPRRWAWKVKLGRRRLIDAPWLWCRCGDSLESWQEARRGLCHLCQDWIENYEKEDELLDDN